MVWGSFATEIATSALRANLLAKPVKENFRRLKNRSSFPYSNGNLG
jgi:hypothetical protein